MKITVRLFATLRENRKKEMTITLSDNSTPRDVVKTLNIDEKDAALILINGKGSTLDSKLKENDVLSIFPPVGGG